MTSSSSTTRIFSMESRACASNRRRWQVAANQNQTGTINRSRPIFYRLRRVGLLFVPVWVANGAVRSGQLIGAGAGCCLGFGGGQPQMDARAAAALDHRAFDVDIAAQLFDDAVHQCQTEAGALAGLLGGEEWLEDFFQMLLGDAAALVGDRHMQAVVGARAVDFYEAVVGGG